MMTNWRKRKAWLAAKRGLERQIQDVLAAECNRRYQGTDVRMIRLVVMKTRSGFQVHMDGNWPWDWRTTAMPPAEDYHFLCDAAHEVLEKVPAETLGFVCWSPEIGDGRFVAWRRDWRSALSATFVFPAVARPQ